MTAYALRPVPGPSIDPQADNLHADCRAWTDLHAMIARLNDQAAEIADRIMSTVGDDDQPIEFVDSTGEQRTLKIVRVPIRTIDPTVLEAALPKAVFKSLLAAPTVDREKAAAAVKLGQIDPTTLADATTVTHRRPYLRVSTVKR